jgi:HlyD family secretion protein
VLLVKDGTATRQPVTLGLRGVGSVEILGGLAEGDRVVPAGNAIRAGQRLRPVSDV